MEDFLAKFDILTMCIIYIIFNYMYVCASACGVCTVSAGAHGGQRCWIFLEPEL